MKKYLGWIILFNIVVLLCIFLIRESTCSNEPENENILPDNLSGIVSEPDVSDTISLVAVGDVMLGTDYPSKKYLHPSGKCNVLLQAVNEYLLNADLTFGNIEGVFAGNKGVAKHCNNPDQCYIFRMPVEYVNCLVESGFDLISVANNHVNDFGAEGRKNTAKILYESNLLFAGFSDHPYVMFDTNGVKYGFTAFAPHTGCNDMRDIQNAVSIVNMLDSVCDVVIVSFHAGAEGKNNQHVTQKDEIFLGYNRGNVYEFTHKMIDEGADVLIGHGPHVTRAVEVYKERFIAYSLGNFCTYRRFNLSGPNGFAPVLNLYVSREGKFLGARLIPITQQRNGFPEYDSTKTAIKKVIELTKSDFPKQDIIIHPEGTIFLKE